MSTRPWTPPQSIRLIIVVGVLGVFFNSVELEGDGDGNVVVTADEDAAALVTVFVF